jgi:hypothetical protein
VLSIIRVQGDRIDHAQLVADAGQLGLGDLAARAVKDSSVN